MPARQPKPAVDEIEIEKPLPDSPDVERLTLGACLNDPRTCADVVESLVPEDFSLEKHKRIFAAIAYLTERGDGVGRVTIANELKGRGQLESVDGLSYLAALDEGMPALVQIRQWIKILQEKARLRKIILVGQDLINAAQSEGEESERILKRFDEQFYRLSRTTGGSYVTKLSDYMDSQTSLDLLDPKRSSGIGLPTGFKRLDELTDGFHAGEVWVGGAATGVGKTSFALQIATYLAERGIPVLFYSMEMPKASILGRIMCRKAMVSVMRWRSGELSQNERYKLMEAAEWARRLPLYIDDTAALRTSDVYLRTRRSKEQHGVQLAVIDYLQKMRAVNTRANMNDQITEICESIQISAKELVPFLVLSQLSREHKKLKRKPQLDDLRASGSVEQFANVVVMPYRPETENPKDQSLRGKAEFLLRKNRDGETEEIPMRYVGWLMQFEDCDAPNSYMDE